MEAKAIKRHIRISPRKIRLVVDLIRGKRASEALAILKYTPKGATKEVENVLRSAISNLQNIKDRGNVNPENVIVKKAFVDQSVTLKRILPAPMGRAYRLRKRSGHITIVVEELPEVIKQPKQKKGEKSGAEN
ncbi:MAG: 50S ribosomal protein L22 [Ignavibacteria bacterium]|nr:50S ribosomal protein L22 [Ignavibacteria bacterium]